MEGWKWTSFFYPIILHSITKTMPNMAKLSLGLADHLEVRMVWGTWTTQSYIYNSGFQTITAEPYKIIRLMPMNFPKIGSQPSRIIWVILAWSKYVPFFWSKITIFDVLAPGFYVQVSVKLPTCRWFNPHKTSKHIKTYWNPMVEGEKTILNG